MFDFVKWIIANVPSEVLFFLLFLFFGLEYTKLKNLEKMIACIQKGYDEHINKSTQSDRETLRSRLRKLHIEVEFYVKASKKIPEQIIEEFYSAFDLYIELGGNGYIKRLKEDVDEWVDAQRKAG